MIGCCSTNFKKNETLLQIMQSFNSQELLKNEVECVLKTIKTNIDKF